ncbi:MAG: aminotransferase class III-fold pyridoxal phosphate-dependent enzyme [Bacteroidota bacterium]
MTTPLPQRPVLTRAEGLYVQDSAGRRYLDATSGAFCMQLGYTRPDLAGAMAQSASRLPHARPSVFDSEEAERYRAALLEAAGAPFARVLLTSSGSEAVETAIQAAWWWQRANGSIRRRAILSLSGHFHGATLGALAATGLPERRAPFETWLGEGAFGPAAHCVRCFRGLTHPSCGLACADAALERAEEAAALIAESVPAAGLAAAAPPEGWCARVRARCDETGALWIADETLTGFGRTGDLFAWPRLASRDGAAEPPVPDLVVFGKGASAGFFPLAGVLVSRRVAEALDSGLEPFRHVQTFGESPIGCAVGLRALEAYRNESIFERARSLESEAARALEPLREREAVYDVRGLGLLWGVELAAGPSEDGRGGTRAPFPRARQVAREVAAGCRARGVLVHASAGFLPGRLGDAILVAPPLVTGAEELSTIAAALGEAIEAAAPAGGGRPWVEEWEDR